MVDFHKVDGSGGVCTADGLLAVALAAREPIVL